MDKIWTINDLKADFETLKDLIPKVSVEELHILWDTDFYDGPLQGVLEYNDKKYWFEIVSDYINDRTRYFALVELNEEEYDKELYWQKRFEEHISQGFSEERQSEWENSYKVYDKQREYATNRKQVVGYFLIK